MGDSVPETAGKPNFVPLEGTYQILGELRGSRNTRSYMAKRRSDGEDVTITVHQAQAGQGANELSHYAADVKLLSELRHPNLVNVIEARWIGPSLAVVSERVQGSTLADLLDRDERFANPRIAAILNEVFAVLDWARARGVVHRGVPPINLYFEEDTQRVLVALGPTAIPISGVPDAGADAKTIGTLAWAMLTGKPYSADKDAPRLGQLEPDLASRVIDATEELVRSDGAETSAPDVRTILGVLAAGDVLKQAEVEMAALKEEYHEQHRAELAKCEHHRMEVEQHAAEAAAALAEDRATWEKRVAAKDAELTDKSADFDRVMMERQQQLAAVRVELEAQAEELERRLSDFDERRTQFERVALQYQKSAKSDQKSAKKGKGAKQEKGSKSAKSAPVPLLGVPISFAPDRKEEKSRRAMRTKMLANLDAPARPPGGNGSSRKRWVISGVAGALAVALVATVLVVRHENGSGQNSVTVGKTTVVPTAGPLDQRTPSRAGFLSQSAGGTVVPGPVGAPYAKPGDSIAITQPAKPDTEPTSAPKPRPREPSEGEGMQAPPSRVVPPVAPPVVPPRVEPVRPDSISVADTVRSDGTRVRDSSFRVGRDSIVIRSTYSRPEIRRDTTARPDSAARRDSTIRRDTIRPDSRIPPNTMPF